MQLQVKWHQSAHDTHHHAHYKLISFVIQANYSIFIIQYFLYLENIICSSIDQG